MEKYTSRKDVPEKYKWDLTPFFKNEEEFEEKFNQATKDVDSLKEFAGCTKDANKLYEFLAKDINTAALVENIYVYSYLINDQELGVSSSIERKNKAESLMNKYMINTSFFSPELLKLSEEEYNKLFVDNESLNEFKSGFVGVQQKEIYLLHQNQIKI